MGTTVELYTDSTLSTLCMVPAFMTGSLHKVKPISVPQGYKGAIMERYVVPAEMESSLDIPVGYVGMFNRVLQAPTGRAGYEALYGSRACDMIFPLTKAINALGTKKSGNIYAPNEGEAREMLETLLGWALIRREGIFHYF